MALGTILREVQLQYGFTNKTIGKQINYSEEMISKIKSGERRVPVDALPKLAELSPRIGLEVYANLPKSVITSGWLDGDVDLSMLAVTEKLREEVGELAEDLSKLRLVNKTCRERLTVGDMEELLHVRQEAYDVMLALALWLMIGAQTYSIDMDAETKEHRDKLTARRYIKKKSRYL